MSSWTDQLVRWIEQSCFTEVLSPKPGNVTPGKDFADATVDDFVHSAKTIAPILAGSEQAGVGISVYRAVEATQRVVGHNTNLGIILLLAPLAAVPPELSLQDGIRGVLDTLNQADTDWTYRAIRKASPGGLGAANEQDVNSTPTESLLECMRLAAGRDLIARQYATGFRDVLEPGLQWLIESQTMVPEPDRIAWTALQLLSHYGDTLIARKCGQDMSDVVRDLAKQVLERGWPHSNDGRTAFSEYDAFLREDGHQRNPGTTADMIAAIVFAGFRSGDYAANDQLLSPFLSQDSL